jgi:integrase
MPLQKDAGRYVQVGEDPDRREHLDEWWLSEALDQAKEIAEEHDEETADRFMRVVKGEATFLRDVYPPWLDETRPKPKQRDAHSKVMRDYMRWAGNGISVEETDRKRAGGYLSHLASARSLAPKTVAHYRSSLSTLWVWLEEKGITGLNNPWANHKSLRAAVRTKRVALIDTQLTSLLSGSYDTQRYRRVLADLLRLALVTGCRLEELCGLRKTDVVKRKDGYWLVIVQGKTAAAEREVPVHPAVNHIVERRRGKRMSEYLFGDLTPGAYGRRSHHVSKAYGRYRRQVGSVPGGRTSMRYGTRLRT